MTGGTAMTKNTMTKNTMTKVTWTLDDEGRLTARWNVPTAKAAALAAYYRLQTALARRSAA